MKRSYLGFSAKAAVGVLALGLSLGIGCAKDDPATPPAGGTGGSKTGGTGGGGTATGGTGGGGTATGGGGGTSTGGAGGGGAGGAGDTAAGETGGGATPTFTQVQAVFSRKFCTACHAGGTGATLPSAMDLKKHEHLLADSIQCTGAMAKKRVKPGDVAGSYLINKLRGVGMCSGDRMPKGTPAASEDDIKLVEDWVKGGAPM